MLSHFVMNMIYITIGGVCFSYLERGYDQDTTPTTADIVTSILNQLGKWLAGDSFTNTEIKAWIINYVLYILGAVITSR